MPAMFDGDWKAEWMQLRVRLAELQGMVFTPRQPIGDLWQCKTGLGRGPEGIPKEGWNPFKVMERWGGHDQTVWFRMQAVVPKSFTGKRVVAILKPCAYTDIPGRPNHEESGEALAYVNGRPHQGIDRHHDFMVLAEKGKAGDTYDIAMEAYAGARYDATHMFACADLAVMNTTVWDLYWDGAVLLDVVKYLPEDSAVRRRLLLLTTEALRMVDLQHKDEPAFLASVDKARVLLQKWLKGFTAGPDTGGLALIGHSHIDTAWLWPLRETRRKVGRTFSTVLRLMERYPEFCFSASQPELYMFVKENHPEIWKQIKRRVKEGRWEVCGAPWVEQDSQMPCGEALVRQFLYGNRFFEKEFGRRTKVAWLPDAFGFPWSLPQIMRKAQLDTFCTTKLNWNRYTRFPHSLFMWQGADGSRIRAVMTINSYNGDPHAAELNHQWNNFAQKHLVDEAPFSFGWGDGGGGPSPRMMEFGKRMKNLPGIPKCRFSRTDDHLDRMKKAVKDSQLPVWNGELYLELHRACQTTQGRTKRNNRKSEWLLHNAELLSTWAMLQGGAYEQDTLAAAWRVLLTHQFHDILPGSSVNVVYKDADENYSALQAQAAGVLDRAAAYLAGKMDLIGPGAPILLWNTLSFERYDIAEVRMPLPEGPFHVTDAAGAVAPHQVAADGTLLIETDLMPPLGFAAYRLMPGAAAPELGGPVKATAKRLENDFFLLLLDDCGRFTRLYDKLEEREVLAPGQKGNAWQLFEDRPAEHDAWDFDANFADRMWEPGKAESIEVLEQGPVRAVVRVVRRTEKSVFTQDITMYAGSPRIDVRCTADWHEKRVLLKVAFPVNILSPRATYDIQFAAIERATHENTDFDRARFEVTAHQWADLAEGDYGVSLLNDCKYGYDVRDNVLRLSLLRAPVDPDPHADEGLHQFSYALLPHSGSWRDEVVEEGYKFNAPLLAFPITGNPSAPKGDTLEIAGALAMADADHIIIDTIKKAEDSNAVIVRLHEACGQRGKVQVLFRTEPKAVYECDLMEENDQPLALCDPFGVELAVTPFEIRTLKVVF